MPARWSMYDTSPLPDPEDGGGGKDDGGPPADAPTSKGLVVLWDRFHVPSTVTPDWVAFANNTGADKGASDGSGDPAGGTGAGGEGGSESGGGTDGDLPPAPERSVLYVSVDDLLELEQRILDQAKVFASQFNELRNRSQSVAGDGMWGLNETQKMVQGQGNYWSEVETPSAQATRQFLKSFLPTQQVALQHTANMVVTTGMLIELLDKSAEIYATQDQRSVFPDKDSIVRAETDPG